MTRAQVIDRWAGIVKCVFAAELAIKPQWKESLERAKGMSDEDKVKIAKAYCDAVAAEIVSKTSDEQLAEMYKDINL